MQSKQVRIFLGLVFALTWVCFGLGASREPAGDLQIEQHTAGVRLVLVDVIVSKDGRFVTDLTQDDFRIYEDGEEVPVYSFELISFAEASLSALNNTETDVLSPQPQQQFIYLFDCVNSWARDVNQLKKDAREELLALVDLGAQVSVLQLTWEDGLEIIQPFTEQKDLVQTAVDKALGTWWESGSQLSMLDGIDTTLDDTGAAAELQEFIRQQQLEDHRLLEKNKLEKTIGGILTACNLIKDTSGRKSILLVSSGIPDLVSLNPAAVIPTGRLAISSSSRRTLDAVHATGYAKNKVRIFDPFHLLPQTEFENGSQAIQEIVRFANTHNIAIHSLAPVEIPRAQFTGASAEYRRPEEMRHLWFNSYEASRRLQNLESLSKNTSAVSLRGKDRIEDLRQLIRTDLSFHYLLSYLPPRERADDVYHKIKVKVSRKGVKIRSRNGYIDYSEDNERNMLLVSAFYSPDLYKKLPFEAEFIPFFSGKDTYEPWVNFTLPCQSLFLDRYLEPGPRRLNLHFWVQEQKKHEKGYSSEIQFPYEVDKAFLDHVSRIDNIVLHFKGEEVTYAARDYRVVMALIDPETDEIGTWETSLTFPDFGKLSSGSVLSCTLGTLGSASAVDTHKKTFQINAKDGSLEYPHLKFIPSVTARFYRPVSAQLFMQVYLSDDRKSVEPIFSIKGEDGLWRPVRDVLLAQERQAESKLWNGLFHLDLDTVEFGENLLSVEVPGTESGVFSARQIKVFIR